MSNLNIELPTSYGQAKAMLDGSIQKKVGYKTWLETNSFSDPISVRHHTTPIVKFYADGRIVVGVWNSRTSIDRINRCLEGVGHHLNIRDGLVYSGDEYLPDGKDWVLAPGPRPTEAEAMDNINQTDIEG